MPKLVGKILGEKWEGSLRTRTNVSHFIRVQNVLTQYFEC